VAAPITSVAVGCHPSGMSLLSPCRMNRPSFAKTCRTLHFPSRDADLGRWRRVDQRSKGAASKTGCQLLDHVLRRHLVLSTTWLVLSPIATRQGWTGSLATCTGMVGTASLGTVIG
jgi:hypothetical protein